MKLARGGLSAHLDILLTLSLIASGSCRQHRSVGKFDVSASGEHAANNIEFIWSSTTIAVGDTAVLHCSFDAIFSQLRNGNIDWIRESSVTDPRDRAAASADDKPYLIATGRKIVTAEKRYRVFRPHNSALSVLIIRRAKKKDAGIFRCNLSGSTTRHKYMILNVTESKIDAQTSPAKLRSRIGKDVILWCNATGYPKPMVYWTREDRNRKLPDGSYQHWGNGLYVRRATEEDTGIYACYLDNFVQPVVSYRFNLMIEDQPWHVDAFKMRFDSSKWYRFSSDNPKPILGMSYLLMCETRGAPRPLPRIRWFKDGKELRNSRHYYLIDDRPEWRSTYASSTLVIMRFSPQQQGDYTCVATNVFRMKKRKFNINGYKLIAPGGKHAAGVGPTSGAMVKSIFNLETRPNSEGTTTDRTDGRGSTDATTAAPTSANNVTARWSDDEDYAEASGLGSEADDVMN